ncbi:MAG TPA: serine hydrolase domain-containing protein [Myxococcota bacterium]|nr:serine hydrolase domain-containing protein [Myxococcota bacterium]
MLERAQELLDRAVQEDCIPCYALLLRGPDDVRGRIYGGHASLRPRPRRVFAETPWDLASLTKVLCTASLMMSLHEKRILPLETPLRHWITGVPETLTAAHCLSHSSGLPPWRPLYADVLDAAVGSAHVREAILQAAAQTPPMAEPGQRYAYSDLGILVLTAAIEAAGGDRIDRLWERHVRGPTGVDLRWGWPGAAATEDCPVRAAVQEGQVHDLNAWAMGGISGHAGLFGPVDAPGELAAEWLRCRQGRPGLWKPQTLQRFWSEGGAGSHRLGWDRPTPPHSSAGPLWPADGVGHLGFTGCSIWIAPRQGWIVVLLSNRVHPVVEGGSVPGQDGPRTRAFRALRPAVHQAIVESLTAAGEW